jgi:hypothetical protein
MFLCMARFSPSIPSVARRSRSGLGPLLALGLLLATVGAAQPAAAQFRDVGYTFEPTVQGIFDSENASLQNEPLYGGTLGLSFGRYFRVNAEYLANTGATTNFTNVDRLSGLLDRDLDVRRYGTRLRLNLLDRRVIPYLTAGTGVLQLDPRAVEATRTIYGLAGGGFAFRLQDRFRFSVSGELLSYRYDPVATYLGPSGAANFGTGTELVRTPALTASASLFLGGRSLDEETAVDAALREQFGSGGLLANTRLFVNPIYGRIEFNDALGFPKDQNVFGLHAGVDLGPFVGLRGFYWRGTGGESIVDDVAGDLDNIQMYGSELQLRLNLDLGRGFVPYARVGGGYLDVQNDYADDLPEGALVPDDRFFGVTGAGLEVPVSRSLKLSGGVRGLIMSNPNVVEAGAPGDLYGSAMYSAGIEFRLGGGRDRPEPEPEPLPGPSPVGAAPEAPAAAGDTGGDRPPRASDTDVEGEDLTPRERRLLARVDSLERALQGNTARAADTGPPRSNVSDRSMTVPVPEEGEIYVRFGGAQESRPARADTTTRAAGAADRPLTSEQIRRRVERTLRQQLRQQRGADSLQANVEQAVDRALRNALRDRQQRTAQQEGQSQQIQRLQDQIEQLRRDLRAQQSAEPASAQPAAPAEPAASPPFYRELLGRPLTYLVPVTGYRGGDGLSQFQIGVRGDYRTSPSSPFYLIPELTFGVGSGDGLSPNLLANVAYSVFRDRVPALTGVPLQPYVGAGIGIASTGGFTFEPVLNTMIGADYRVRGRQAVFLEYSTLDLGDAHRVHVGYRIRF